MEELRRKISEVQRNESLSTQEKHQRIHQLTTEFHSKKFLQETEEEEECPHYNRGCLVECDKCLNFVNCRLCHEELDRFKVKRIKCKECGEIESLPLNDGLNCKKCDNSFASYYCKVCNLFELDEEKSIFHCEDCGICRRGLREDYFHCAKCNMCILNTENHKCFQNSFQAKCVICSEDLFDNVNASSLLKCGHAMHQTCLQEYVQHDYRCPICKKSIGDMTHAWDRIRAQLQENQNPVTEHKVSVLCHDCEIYFETPKSFYGLYECENCKGFNCSE